MQAMLEALEDGLAEPERYLPAMREQVRALSELVDDLFELARIDAGVLTLEIREAQLSGARRVVPARARGGGARRGTSRSRRASTAARRFAARPTRSSASSSTCLTNALRHTPSDGSVAVLVEPLRRARCR